ncbi:LysR family transcriptional regulator [Cytobacillus praedii]|uniref:LysR family transcriptional regulator n=1 Tax=Cytobacillus praedii TaxID=1742358 RepID=UPI002E1DD24B|nr:LysR family transcriptional regulator [Cytobacillus praedii]
MKSFDKLAAFVAVVEHGSFSKAADVIYCSQPALSMKIRSLEEQLNIQLLYRPPHPIGLTSYGEKYLPIAKELCRLHQQSVKMLLQMKEQEETTIKLYVSSCMGMGAITSAVTQFKKQQPKVSLQIVHETNQQLIQKVESGAISEVIISVDSICDLLKKGSNLNKELIYEETFYAVCANEKIQQSESKEHCILLTDCGCPMRQEVDEQLIKNNIIINQFIEFNQLECIKQSVLQKQGIAYLPESIIRNEIKMGSVKKVDLPSFKKSYYIIYHPKKSTTQLLLNFISNLKLSTS